MSTTELTGCEEGRQSNRITYRYDSLGQLIRANDPFDSTGGVKGTTWVYSYDQGGNILSKVAYSFTEKETISEAAVHTDTYAYDNASWTDQLTAYNDVPITYDAIGNPLNDGEWTYTWQHGRQLASMSKAGETVSFVYNEDGIRVQKTSTSTGTTKYTLHGKKVVHLTNGNDDLHFFYDAQGRVAVVDYNGASYRYMHNLQGDIIALVDENGNKVIEYWYDAWGKPTKKTGSLADTLGRLQPFRYRNYVLDEETGLYYLRGRYYRPIWERFQNADNTYDRNIFVYCINNPIVRVDSSGHNINAFDALIDAMNAAVEEFRAHIVDDLATNSVYVFISNLERNVNNYLWFAKKMDHHAEWDIKDPDRWAEKFPNVPQPTKKSKVTVLEEEATSEDLGNLAYGYLGTAMGFSPKTLYLFGGVANYYHGGIGNMTVKDLFDSLDKALADNEYYGDDKNDHLWIEKGIELYWQLNP